MPIPDDQIEEKIRAWTLGNDSAALFLMNIAAVSRLADDIVDGDTDSPVKDMGQLLARALVDNGENPFYQRHHAALAPAMLNAIAMWDASETWKRSENRKTRMFAFVYREGVEHVLHTVALIVGGFEHAKQVMKELHEVSHQSSAETFEDWENEHGCV